MSRMLGLLLVAALLTSASARADVSWNLVATSAVDSTSGMPLPLSSTTIGGLTVSDAIFLRGGLSSSYTGDFLSTGEITFIGDTDFNLNLGNYPAPMSGPSTFYMGDFIELVFSLNGEITGTINNNTISNDFYMEMFNNIASGIFNNDGPFICGGGMTNCMVDGYWQLTSALPLQVPEPSGLAILVGAIAILGMLRRRSVLAN